MPNLNLILKSQGDLGSEGLLTLLKPIFTHHIGAFMGVEFQHESSTVRSKGGVEVPNLNMSLKTQGGLESEGLFTLLKPVLTHHMGALMGGPNLTMRGLL